jgi:hypothetical protein
MFLFIHNFGFNKGYYFFLAPRYHPACTRDSIPSALAAKHLPWKHVHRIAMVIYSYLWEIERPENLAMMG